MLGECVLSPHNSADFLLTYRECGCRIDLCADMFCILLLWIGEVNSLRFPENLFQRFCWITSRDSRESLSEILKNLSQRHCWISPRDSGESLPEILENLSQKFWRNSPRWTIFHHVVKCIVGAQIYCRIHSSGRQVSRELQCGATRSHCNAARITYG